MSSVIICAHNPRPHYLGQTLDALRAQSLARDKWELLVIDNASREPLSEHLDLSLHGGARIVREDRLGLTPARLRSIQETEGDLLQFFEDLYYTRLQAGRIRRILALWEHVWIQKKHTTRVPIKLLFRHFFAQSISVPKLVKPALRT